MTISLEYRKVKGKHLLIKFLFDSHNDASYHGLVCNSVDKYMSLDVWMKLYEKLGKPIDRYVKNETKQPTEETISMQRAQLDLHISWKKVDALHSAMCDLTPDAVYKYLLLVDVCTYSRVEDFVKKGAKTKSLVNGHAVSLENENLPQSTTVNGSGINDGNGKPNIADTNKRRHEEYVPEASTASPKHSNLRYTPSKNFETDADEYTPTKVIVVDAGTAKCDNIEDGHHYFPSPINNNNHYEFTDSKPYSRGQIKSPRPNKIRMSASKTTMVEPFGHERMPSADGKATSKANLSQDLFGDSSGSDAEAKEPPAPVIPLRSKPERKAKLVAQKSISSIGALKPSKLSSLASNSAKSSSSGRKALPTPSSSNFAKIFKLQGESVECLVKSPDEKRNDKKGAEKSVEKPKISNEERETEMINKLILEKIANNTLTDSSGKQIGLTCLIDLKDLSIEEIAGTFDDYADTMKKLFDAKRWECRPRPSPEYCPYTLNPILLRVPQMYTMVDTLTKELTNEEEHGPIPFHHLFWECMLPEWALLIFMTKYNLTREEALDQVRKHDLAFTLNSPTNFDQI